jgi:hypothetical protein
MPVPLPAPESLPAQFADLAPFLAEWALPTEAERSQRRWRSSKTEFEAFYAAMMPRLPDILAYLGGIPVVDTPADAVPLLYLTLAFAETAPHVELYRGSAQVPHSFDPRRFVASHGDAAG